MTSEWTPEQLDVLRRAREQHRAQPGVEHYDEVLHEVTERVTATGDLGKADIGALLFWKRLRADTPWATSLHLRPDHEVRRATQGAREAMADQPDLLRAASAGRSALVGLPGFSKGDALASAVLTALAPQRMAIYDTRAHAALRQLGTNLDDRAERYSRYMGHVASLAAVLATGSDAWDNRDVDLALYRLGGRGSAAPPPSTS